MRTAKFWEALASAFVIEIRRPDGSRVVIPNTMFGCYDFCPPIELPHTPHTPDRETMIVR